MNLRVRMETHSHSHALLDYYDAMYAALGPQHWWPSSPSGGAFEIIVGAILTQSTAWANVERAIANLRRERLLTPRAIERVPLPRLARLVRPSGYFRQKAKKLKAFVRFLRREFGGSLVRMFRTPTERLRPMLLEVHGIGPETADSILLYAGSHPVFVVDAYTRRVLERHGWIQTSKIEIRKSKPGLPLDNSTSPGPRASFDFRFSNFPSETKAASIPGTSYDEIQQLFAAALPRDAQLYNEYHALLVHVGKHWCRPREPKCHACPLRQFLPEEKARLENRNPKLTRSGGIPAPPVRTAGTQSWRGPCPAATPTTAGLRFSNFDFRCK